MEEELEQDQTVSKLYISNHNSITSWKIKLQIPSIPPRSCHDLSPHLLIDKTSKFLVHPFSWSTHPSSPLSPKRKSLTIQASRSSQGVTNHLSRYYDPPPLLLPLPLSPRSSTGLLLISPKNLTVGAKKSARRLRGIELRGSGYCSRCTSCISWLVQAGWMEGWRGGSRGGLNLAGEGAREGIEGWESERDG